jgi:hypothetical protein
MAIAYDGAAKIITLDTNFVQAEEIWSRWVDWYAENSNWLPALKQVGGDDLGSGLYIPLYFFLLNGWRVRPLESDHTLTIVGNLLPEGGGVPVVRTLGPYQVNVNYTVPVLAQGISVAGGSGPSAEEIADAVVAALPSVDLSGIPAAVWSRVIEDGLSAEQIVRILVAVAAGNATGLEGPNPVFNSLDNSKPRVLAEYLAGARTVTSRDGS